MAIRRADASLDEGRTCQQNHVQNRQPFDLDREEYRK